MNPNEYNSTSQIANSCEKLNALVHRRLDSEGTHTIYFKTQLQYDKMIQQTLDTLQCLLKISGQHQFYELVPNQPIECEPNDQPNEFDDSPKDMDTLNDALDISETSMTSKAIVHEVAERLKDMPVDDYICQEVSDCRQIIYRWYFSRYLPKKRDPQFHYQATKIPDWIDAIIIAYGEAWHNRFTRKFKNKMNDWLSAIEQGNSDPWALPYFIQETLQSKEPDDFNYEAIMLEREISRHLFDSKFFYNHKGRVARIIKEHNQDIVDIPDKSDLLRRCTGYGEEDG